MFYEGISKGAELKSSLLIKSLLNNGYAVLDWSIFSNTPFAVSSKRENLDLLLSELRPVQDQPGC